MFSVVIQIFYSVLATFLGLLAVWLLICILYRVTRGFFRRKKGKRRQKPVSVMIVVGSGGHTTEILRLMSGVEGKYYPRHFVVARCDRISEKKIHTFEHRRVYGSEAEKNYKVHRIPRSRSVGQSYITSILTTLYASLYCFPLVCKIRPNVILCNGPGTCIPLCFAGLFLKHLLLLDINIVYVESLCRVQTLSLSARLLLPIIDHILVQWPQLKEKYPGVEFIGRLV